MLLGQQQPPTEGLSSAAALAWAAIVTTAGAALTGTIGTLWLTIRQDRKDHADALKAKDAAHVDALKAERDKHESLRVECAGELRSLHGAHAEALRSFAAEMREELCPACRANESGDREHRDRDRRRLP